MTYKEINKRITLLNKVKKDPKFHKFIKNIVEMLYIDIFHSRSCIYTAGCGGSHSEADHLTGELLGRYNRNRKPYNSECLSGASAGVISCIANDFGWKYSISRQLAAKTNSAKNDTFIAFSTSGNSPNIVRALDWCQRNNIYTFALLGKTGGKAFKLANEYYIVPSNDTALIQEIHQIIIHLIMEKLENKE